VRVYAVLDLSCAATGKPAPVGRDRGREDLPGRNRVDRLRIALLWSRVPRSERKSRPNPANPDAAHFFLDSGISPSPRAQRRLRREPAPMHRGHTQRLNCLPPVGALLDSRAPGFPGAVRENRRTTLSCRGGRGASTPHLDFSEHGHGQASGMPAAVRRDWKSARRAASFRTARGACFPARQKAASSPTASPMFHSTGCRR